MTDASTHLSRLSATFRQEMVVGGIIGGPALGYVFATNEAASRSLVLLHASLLIGLVPLSTTLVDHAMPATTDFGWPTTSRALGVSMLGLLVGIATTVWLIAALTPLTLQVLVGRPLAVALVPVFLAYALATMVRQWAQAREQALLAKVSESRARHAALVARVRPHFLFNALNCIEELTDTDPPAARRAVGRLAHVLRSVLVSSTAPTARLVDEARLVDDYLGIEQIRFGARFRYDLRVSPQAALRMLPATVLLTLAENAVKHGCEITPGPVHLELNATIREGHLVVSISGPDAPAPEARGTGYGLADVQERLELAYGNRAHFQLSTADGRSRVELVLP